MKILIINGSPRKSGNTDQVIRAIKSLKTNIKFTELPLRNIEMHLPDGCFNCAEGNVCPNMDDEFERDILPKLPEYEGYLFVTPTHNNGVSALTKIFIDRIGRYCTAENNKIRGKKVMVIVHGQADESSYKYPLNWLKSVVEFMNMSFIDSYTFKSGSKMETGEFDSNKLKKMIEKL